MIFGNDVPNQKALRQSEDHFRTLVETTDAIIFIIQDRQFCYVNPAGEAVTGYKQEELLTRCELHQLLNVLPEVARPCQLKGKECRQVHKQGESTFPQYQEIKILTKSGKERWLDCSVAVLDFDGKPALLVTAINITERKQAELEIRQALEQEKERSEQRAHFLSMLSHEVRTPMNIVSFATSLLQRHSHQWTEEEKRPYLDCIQTTVEQISQSLDQVLILGKAKAGQLKFEPSPLDLVRFCNCLVAQMQVISNSSQRIITFVSQGNCSTVHVDKKLLQPILTNLLSNAIKYSPTSSTVDLNLSCRQGNVIFQIKDWGIGIPVADQQRLFEPFHRGSNVGDVPGTGLGLAVVKKLVDLHCGQITVASQVGTGTTFTVTLPLVSKCCGK